MGNTGVTGMIVKFTKAKETKGTWKFDEDGKPEEHKVGSLYIKKATVEKLGSPEKIVVEIKKG